MPYQPRQTVQNCNKRPGSKQELQKQDPTAEILSKSPHATLFASSGAHSITWQRVLCFCVDHARLTSTITAPPVVPEASSTTPVSQQCPGFSRLGTSFAGQLASTEALRVLPNTASMTAFLLFSKKPRITLETDAMLQSRHSADDVLRNAITTNHLVDICF